VLVILVLVGVAVMSGGDPEEQPAGPPPPPPQGVPGSWAPIWSDDFDGDSLDQDIWQPSRFGGDDGDAPFEPDLEAAWFSPSNVGLEDGSLVLTLEEEERELTGRTYPYRSGVVQTTESHWIEPGTYVEARIQVPECEGCWPAFWLVATDRWPPEIDIFEFFGTDEESRPSFNYHPEDGDQTGPDPFGEEDTDYRESFHTYGVLWDDDRAIPYVDGKAYPEAAADDVTSLPLMLILNLSVELDAEPDGGSEMLVDWVRVWRPADQ
jgi:beta-glucanase (GH16 family)